MDSTKTRICFVAQSAYGALTGWPSGHIGGIERQTSLMAHWLAARGYRVSLITWDEGQEDGVVIDGVQVFKVCRQEAGIKGLRFLHPKWTSLCRAMKRADADIYYHNCAEYVTGQVALWCRNHGRTFVYSIASDPDCDRRLPEMHKLRERVLYRYGLKHAARIVVQTRRQQDMLRNGFRRNSVVIPMPCPGPSDDEYSTFERPCNGARRVLWVGRVCRPKRPDRLLDLAVACPDVHFDLVGPVAGTGYGREILQRAKAIVNVTLHGPVSRARIPEFYRTARILCCTSDFEGFPNTFLEAWSYGLPVVSTVDPDNIITEKGLGAVGGDIPDLAAGMCDLLMSPDRWQKASQNARHYYSRHHTMDKIMPEFERLFTELVQTRR